MKNKRLVALLFDMRGQTLEIQYKMIEAYINNEVQRIIFKKNKKL